MADRITRVVPPAPSSGRGFINGSTVCAVALPRTLFPTRYLANTPADVRRLAAKTGFRVEAIDLIEGCPEYLRFSVLTYLGGWMYERLVPIPKLLLSF